MKHLNLSYILENVADDPAFVHMLLDVFVTSLTPDTTALQQSIIMKNYEQIRRDAHKVKSGFRSLGMQEMASRLQTIENLGSTSGDIGEISQLFEHFKKEVPSVLEEIKEYKIQHPLT